MNESAQGDRRRFYQSHLDRVSRSFAFCIARLDPPFRDQIGLAYLLFRILDTVEDALWSGPDEQEVAFQEFASFVLRQPSAEKVLDWTASFPVTIPAGEMVLLKDSPILFADLHQLPSQVRDALTRGLLNMARGMRHYSSNADSHKIRLKNHSDVDRYCFFVAGVVGELLSEIYYRQGVAADQSQTVDRSRDALFQGQLVRSIHFGLFLQKINLLKDQAGDEAEGKFLVPDRTRTLQSLRVHSEQALRYIAELPREDLSFRTFCGWSLFLGLGSLPWIERSFQSGKSQKIPRWRAKLLLRKVENIIGDNDRLMEYYKEMAAKNLPPVVDVDEEYRKEPFPEFFRLYQGPLTNHELSQLGLISGAEPTTEGLCRPEITLSP